MFSPKELFIFEQEKQLLIANIASPQSEKKYEPTHKSVWVA